MAIVPFRHTLYLGDLNHMLILINKGNKGKLVAYQPKKRNQKILDIHQGF
jgi:hypothetical protein